jgi:hypothetical protein
VLLPTVTTPTFNYAVVLLPTVTTRTFNYAVVLLPTVTTRTFVETLVTTYFYFRQQYCECQSRRWSSFIL